MNLGRHRSWLWLFSTLTAETLTAQNHEPNKLPPVPFVEGPLVIRITYPASTDRVDVEDSSFVFGSIGDGRAALTINGQPARVYPNGAFLAWIRYPDESPARLTLVARRGSETVSATVMVHRSDRFRPPDPTKPWIDTTSLWPRGRVWWPRDEVLPLQARAAERVRLELVLPTGKRVSLVASDAPAPIPTALRAFDRDPRNLRRPRIGDRYEGMVRGLRLGAPLPPVLEGPRVGASLRPARVAQQKKDKPLRLEAIRGRDTVRVVWPLELALLDSLPPAALMDDDLELKGGTDRIVVGRPHPGATYHWFFPTGTLARIAGRINDDLRLRLSSDAVAWIAAAEAIPRPGALVANRAIIGSATMTPFADRVEVRIPATRRVPFQVDEDQQAITLTLYGATADLNWFRYGSADSVVALASWRQRSADEVEITFRLSAPVWGYRTRWDGGDLLVDLRRPPVVDRARPLAGRVVVIDPGHPPVGSIGPTGLTEPEANLAVAAALAPMLEAAGARVLLTRADNRSIELWPRVRFADSVNADLLISIHNNALPDGINPFTNSGSSVFYFHPRSLPLARFVQAGLVRELGLPDLGVARGDLALARPTWMPAVLVEGLFMMIPDQEAALRHPEGQRKYAAAVLGGVREFLLRREQYPH